MQRSIDLRINTDYRLQPMQFTGRILDAKACIPLPVRIREIWARDINLIVGKCIAYTDIQTVRTVFVFQQIPVDT